MWFNKNAYNGAQITINVEYGRNAALVKLESQFGIIFAR